MTPHPPICRNGVDPPAGLRLGPHRGRWPAVLTVLNGLTMLALLASLAACSASLLPKPPPPPTRFTLDAQAAATTPREAPAGIPAGAPALVVVVVAVPRAAPGFDSARMVYLRQPQQLEAFAFHEWVDTPARMLAPLLVRALQASASFSAVLQAPSVASSTWRLETELIRLQQDFSSAPSQVRLTLRAVLLDTASRQVIAWREFDATVSAATDDPAGGAAAAHQATQRVLAALTAFCAAQTQR
jgi:cholesterol transport system auxiliary component